VSHTVPPGLRRHTGWRPSRTWESLAQMANRASTRTTQLYDRRREELSLENEVERIRVMKCGVRVARRRGGGVSFMGFENY